jgi:hypothetical protein
MRLEDIGFYTLNDERARNTHPSANLSRCEMILTDRCNFRCPYCRGPKQERESFIDLDLAAGVIVGWSKNGLRNIRFSGGEPTLHDGLSFLVALAKDVGIERIAISTNGSSSMDKYRRLIDLGVNDFSISLDDCTPEGMDAMTGRDHQWKHLTHNTRELSRLVYVTAGMVFNRQNINRAVESVMFAAGLGVADIRVLSSAQFNQAIEALAGLPSDFLARFPVLEYRVNRLRSGMAVRGLRENDCGTCRLAWDDMAVAGDKHYPCIIYMREGGGAIGDIGPTMRQDRARWVDNHNSHQDPICKQNCLDVCVAYNNAAGRI